MSTFYQILTVSEARTNLYRRTDKTTAMQETLFLLSAPDMRESIKAGMAEAVEACTNELDWRVDKHLF
jgi:hypothetical protein